MLNGLCALLRGENVIFKAVIPPNTDSVLHHEKKKRTPYWNLAAEDFILRYLNDAAKTTKTQGNLGSALFLYNSEDPCVVLGRNQNTFAETSLENAALPIVRRRSGGGCVYHDSGCLCFSFIGDRKRYAPGENVQLVETAVSQSFTKMFSPPSTGSPGLVTSTGPRHDLFVNGKKITGSAMRMLQFSAYHHGTLLLTSDIANVRSSLTPLQSRNDAVSVRTRGTPSVRSPVTTLAAEGRKCSNASIRSPEVFRHIIEAMSELFETKGRGSTGRTPCHVIDLLTDDGDEGENILGQIEQSANEMSQWSWTFGDNPEFTVSIVNDWSVPSTTAAGKWTRARLSDLGVKKISLSVKHGRIISLDMESCDRPFEQGLMKAIEGSLDGCHFRRESILAAMAGNQPSILSQNDEGKHDFTLFDLICDACNL